MPVSAQTILEIIEDSVPLSTNYLLKTVSTNVILRYRRVARLNRFF